jgi:hypothetical protein
MPASLQRKKAPQIGSIYEVHCDVMDALADADFEHLHNVRMVEQLGESRFLGESGDVGRILGQLRGEPLVRDERTPARSGDDPSPIDFRHTPFAQQRKDFVIAELVAPSNLGHGVLPKCEQRSRGLSTCLDLGRVGPYACPVI